MNDLDQIRRAISDHSLRIFLLCLLTCTGVAFLAAGGFLYVALTQ